MASMETSAPRSPSLGASRSSSDGMAVSSLALSGTASWPSTRREVVAKAETRCSAAPARAAVVAAARGLAVDGDEVRPFGPGLAHPGGEGGGEQRRVDTVHQDGQPAPAGDAVLHRADGGAGSPDGLAPRGNMVVVVAVGDGAADHQEQDLGQRVGNAHGRRAGRRWWRSGPAVRRGGIFATKGQGSLTWGLRIGGCPIELTQRQNVTH